MAAQTPMDAIKRYLEDAIAAEQHFEAQLRTMSTESNQTEVKELFAQHADETRRQHDRLTERLTALGGKPSGMKSFMAQMFGFAPKTAQLGHDKEEKSTQDLMMAFAVENSEIAMYESMAVAAEMAGDTVTASLAREIQQEERAAARMVWDLIAPSARDSFARVTSAEAARQAA